MSFIPPLMPTLVEKPAEGDGWIHEVKFDGYRSQMVRDAEGVRIFTRRGLDWTSKYRDLAKAAAELEVKSAIIDGEIIVLNEAGLSDFGELRKAITRRQHDLYFVAFDLLHLNGHDQRDMPLEDRREILAALIPDGQRLNREMRQRLWQRVQQHAGKAPKGMKRPSTQWVKPGLIGRVKHLRGEEDLRHASLQDFREED